MTIRVIVCDELGLIHAGVRSILSPVPDIEVVGASGFLSISGPGVPDAGRCDGLSIDDVAPTVLELLGVGGGEDMEGVSLLSELAEAYSSDDQAILSSRLQALYLD